MNYHFYAHFQAEMIELDDQYGHFNAELTSIKVWLGKVRGQLAESDALSEEQQVSAQELDKYKVCKYYCGWVCTEAFFTVSFYGMGCATLKYVCNPFLF